MIKNIRVKPRQSGKTTELLELLELLLSLDRKAVLLFQNRRVLEYSKMKFKHIFNNPKYKNNLLVGEITSLDFLRGCRYDTILVDGYEEASNSNINNLYQYITVSQAILYGVS